MYVDGYIYFLNVFAAKLLSTSKGPLIVRIMFLSHSTRATTANTPSSTLPNHRTGLYVSYDFSDEI